MIGYLGDVYNRDALVYQALEAAGVVVCNSSEVVRWNADKLYLKDLAMRGAPTSKVQCLSCSRWTISTMCL